MKEGWNDFTEGQELPPDLYHIWGIDEHGASFEYADMYPKDSEFLRTYASSTVPARVPKSTVKGIRFSMTVEQKMLSDVEA